MESNHQGLPWSRLATVFATTSTTFLGCSGVTLPSTRVTAGCAHLRYRTAPREGFEPSALRLTAGRSAVELPRIESTP